MTKLSAGRRQPAAIRELTFAELELVSGGEKSKVQHTEIVVVKLMDSASASL